MTKERNSEIGINQIKTISASKDTINEVKVNSHNKKIFAKYIFDKTYPDYINNSYKSTSKANK